MSGVLIGTSASKRRGDARIGQAEAAEPTVVGLLPASEWLVLVRPVSATLQPGVAVGLRGIAEGLLEENELRELRFENCTVSSACGLKPNIAPGSINFRGGNRSSVILFDSYTAVAAQYGICSEEPFIKTPPVARTGKRHPNDVSMYV